jgi:hypothetical protein
MGDIKNAHDFIKKSLKGRKPLRKWREVASDLAQ